MHAGEKFEMWMKKQEKKEECDNEPGTGWTCNLAGDGGPLGTNLANHCNKKKPDTPTSLDDVTKKKWPSQAHHLIPWQQLDDHEVTVWLAESPPEHASDLIADNDYDVDHGFNGKWMPYVSSLSQWDNASTAKKQEIANKVMKAAGIQLHQGPHSFEPYGPDDDGYKTRVDEYLMKIIDISIAHDSVCEDCKDKAKKKGGRPPRLNTVRYMHKASSNLNDDINRCQIFVSRRAAEYYYTFGNPAG
ncbi:MAG: AHH domain-containing protein [Gemmatimonadota bacterium]|nr:AHH domain-containing protein [Gemmatimonadota bacterium]